MNRKTVHPVDILREKLPEQLKGPLRRGWQAVDRHRRPAPLPGLLMWYRQDVPPAVPELPTGLTWRPYSPADLPAWVGLLAANAELGRWSEYRLRNEAKTLVPGTQMFVTDGNRLVAGAGVYDRAVAGAPAWEVGWVARHPAYRGMGLGEPIVAAATGAALALPERRPVFLHTDDHRLAAIRPYLKLGFEPDVSAEPGSAERWRKIRAGLDGRASGL